MVGSEGPTVAASEAPSCEPPPIPWRIAERAAPSRRGRPPASGSRSAPPLDPLPRDERRGLRQQRWRHRPRARRGNALAATLHEHGGTLNLWEIKAAFLGASPLASPLS